MKYPILIKTNSPFRALYTGAEPLLSLLFKNEEQSQVYFSNIAYDLRVKRKKILSAVKL